MKSFNSLTSNSQIKSAISGIVDLLKTIATVFIIAFVIKTFLVQTFIVDGQSMEKSFYNGEYLLVDKLTYRFSEPKRGDVIIFIPRSDPDKNYIKRVIALPGEKVVVEPNKIIVNGKVLNERYLPANEYNTNLGADNVLTVSLGRDEYFVMGDNRDNSKDSRSIGPIHRRDIIGRTFAIVYPFSKLSLVRHQNYQANAQAN